MAGSKRQFFTASIAFSSSPNPKSSNHSDVVRLAVRTDHPPQYASPSVIRCDGLFRVLGARRMNRFGSGNSTADIKNRTW
jgi:hypothetical protein